MSEGTQKYHKQMKKVRFLLPQGTEGQFQSAVTLDNAESKTLPNGSLSPTEQMRLVVRDDTELWRSRR